MDKTVQIGFYFDQTRCSNCFACMVACKDWHDLPAGPVFYRCVTAIEEGQYPDVRVHFLSTACHHCMEPPCVENCPNEAIVKRKSDGIVVVDPERCQGFSNCGICSEVCPYDVPQFGPEPEAVMQKCDLCLDRWAEGKKPICVDACTMRALDADSLESLESKYDTVKSIKGFKMLELTAPAIRFKRQT